MEVGVCVDKGPLPPPQRKKDDTWNQEGLMVEVFVCVYICLCACVCMHVCVCVCVCVCMPVCM